MVKTEEDTLTWWAVLHQSYCCAMKCIVRCCGGRVMIKVVDLACDESAQLQTERTHDPFLFVLKACSIGSLSKDGLHAVIGYTQS